VKLIYSFRLEIIDPSTGKVVRSVVSDRSITYDGCEFLLRSAGDPVNRPPVADTLGIGWGEGSTAPFNPNQTGLQGAFTSLKPATFTYDPAEDRLRATFEASWGENDPSTELILVGEIALFNSEGTMIDRTPITPTPKKPNEAIKVHGVLKFVESESGFTLI